MKANHFLFIIEPDGANFQFAVAFHGHNLIEDKMLGVTAEIGQARRWRSRGRSDGGGFHAFNLRRNGTPRHGVFTPLRKG